MWVDKCVRSGTIALTMLLLVAHLALVVSNAEAEPQDIKDQGYEIEASSEMASGSTGNTTNFTYHLSAGWNQLGWALDPGSPPSASDVLSMVSGSTTVMRWAGGWISYSIGDPSFCDLDVPIGRGFFVKTASATTWTLSGTPIGSKIVSIHAGWNQLGWHNATDTNADDILSG